METLSSSPCQLRLGVDLSCLGLSLTPICSFSILLRKVFTTFSIDHTLGLGMVNITWTMKYIFGDFCIEE